MKKLKLAIIVCTLLASVPGLSEERVLTAVSLRGDSEARVLSECDSVKNGVTSLLLNIRTEVLLSRNGLESLSENSKGIMEDYLKKTYDSIFSEIKVVGDESLGYVGVCVVRIRN